MEGLLASIILIIFYTLLDLRIIRFDKTEKKGACS